MSEKITGMTFTDKVNKAHEEALLVLPDKVALNIHEIIDKIEVSPTELGVFFGSNERDLEVWLNEYKLYYNKFITELSKLGIRNLDVDPGVRIDVKNQRLFVHYRDNVDGNIIPEKEIIELTFM